MSRRPPRCGPRATSPALRSAWWRPTTRRPGVRARARRRARYGDRARDGRGASRDPGRNEVGSVWPWFPREPGSDACGLGRDRGPVELGGDVEEHTPKVRLGSALVDQAVDAAAQPVLVA